MLEALLRRPRRWPFAATYGLWWANHECGRRTGLPARVASRCARMALRAVLEHDHEIRPICALGSAHMMRDFTLVIPTYNRAQQLAALLGYLEAQNADCRVLVLDSSGPEVLAANRERVAASSLDVEFAEFPDLEPIEKWRQGIHKVRTPFCCAVRR